MRLIDVCDVLMQCWSEETFRSTTRRSTHWEVGNFAKSFRKKFLQSLL
jgi:hypothetical protein